MHKAALHHELNAAWAFVERYLRIVRRYFGWEMVFLAYTCVNTLTIAFIGVASGDPRRVLFLAVGAVLWSFLAIIFQEVSDHITWERWEGTLEYTFMAPMRRITHLAGMCAGAVIYGTLRTILVLGVASMLLHISLRGANVTAAVTVLLVSAVPFIGMGLLVGVLPLLCQEKGSQATHIFQAGILLVSGIYYDVSVLPHWMQCISVITPATYTLSAMRLAVLEGAGVTRLLPQLAVLACMGAILMPLGLLVFGAGERWALRHGLLSRNG